jgi:hypothetical protein
LTLAGFPEAPSLTSGRVHSASPRRTRNPPGYSARVKLLLPFALAGLASCDAWHGAARSAGQRLFRVRRFLPRGDCARG